MRPGASALPVAIAVAALLAAGAPGRAQGPGTGASELPPDPWEGRTVQVDPADSLYRDAREALNRGRNERAADLFRRLREEHPDSRYRADALYFEAFALYRTDDEEDLREALSLLDEQGDRFPDAPTRADARSLRVRIRGALARQGDVEAYTDVEAQARGGCGPDQEVRLMALSALQNMNPERAVPILREVLNSRGECSAELRKQAVFLLSQKMTGETVDLLLDLAHENPDPDPEVREAAVFWLSQVRSEEAVDALVSILRTSDEPALQEKALFALSQHRSDRASEVLRDYAERTDAPEEIREQAIFWLGQDRGSHGYLTSLYPRLESRALKEKVIFSVAQSRSAEARQWLLERARDASEPVELRKNALFWLGQSGGDVAGMEGLYGSFEDPELKEQVIFVLSQLGSDGALDALIEIARSETDAELKKKAIFWLGQSDDPRAQEFLLELIRDPGEGDR